MKKSLIFVLSVLGMICLSFSVTAQEGKYIDEAIEEKEVQQTGITPGQCGSHEKPLRIAGFTNYPPFGWTEMIPRPDGLINEDSAVKHGIGLEVLKKIAEEKKIRYVFVPFSSYKEAKRALEWGKIDLLVESYYESNPYSVAQVLYPSYLSNPFVIISLKGTLPNIKDLSELKGKKGLVRYEEMIWPLIQTTLPEGVQIEQISGARNAFKKLVNKEVDFLLTSRYAAEAEMRRFKVTDFVDVSTNVIRNPNIFMVMSKNSKCTSLHKDYFEQRLKELSEDKDFIRTLLSSQIVYWEQKFRKEPSILLTEGFKLEDETEEEIVIDTDELERMKKLKELDPEVLIQQQMEKMKLTNPEPAPFSE